MQEARESTERSFVGIQQERPVVSPIRRVVESIILFAFTTRTNGMIVTRRDRRRQAFDLKRLPPLLGGAIDTERAARQGDAIAQELIEKAGGGKQLRERALDSIRFFR
ncbi:hypothetical protein HY029_00115 [Candidatus Gottesmanbacteria bacterium]|nr:hypothetical protein [Candidatus Gottesmanbacteria bacterium]